MNRKNLVRYILPWQMGVALVAFVPVVLILTVSAYRFCQAQMRQELQRLALVAEARVPHPPTASDGPFCDGLCRDLADLAQARFSVILRSGLVIGDSAQEPGVMENHADRPEVREALSGRVGTATRYSHTVRADLMYVAVPVRHGQEIVAVVRAARPVQYVVDTFAGMRQRTVVLAMVAAGTAVLGSSCLARFLTRTLDDLRDGAERYARGEFGPRLRRSGVAELADLATAMNGMAEQLRDRLDTITRQRNQTEAVLASMVEGVLAVGRDERVILVNHAAAAFLRFPPQEATGRSLQEVVRNAGLQRLALAVLQSGTTTDDEIEIMGPSETRVIEVHASAMGNADGTMAGAVLVLHDLTRLRRLEAVRKAFVANVSHELRTPITSIKGAVESLLDGATIDSENARRFLRMVAKHADRLSAIVEDLLLLAQLERDKEAPSYEMAVTAVAEVLQAACRLCQAKADRKRITVQVQCEPALQVLGNRRLLEQAVVNLLDNAINYSDGGSSVSLSARQHQQDVLIGVADQGCGIPAEHLTRVFERFYRVDKARSRNLGGTGLGLSIVKHIAEAHGGTVAVASQVGKGSVFTLRLPAGGDPLRRAETAGAGKTGGVP